MQTKSLDEPIVLHLYKVLTDKDVDIEIVRDGRGYLGKCTGIEKCAARIRPGDQPVANDFYSVQYFAERETTDFDGKAYSYQTTCAEILTTRAMHALKLKKVADGFYHLLVPA